MRAGHESGRDWTSHAAMHGPNPSPGGGLKSRQTGRAKLPPGITSSIVTTLV